jgi:hypothetical protein
MGVKPDALSRWHRKGFQLFRRRGAPLSRRQPGVAADRCSARSRCDAPSRPWRGTEDVTSRRQDDTSRLVSVLAGSQRLDRTPLFLRRQPLLARCGRRPGGPPRLRSSGSALKERDEPSPRGLAILALRAMHSAVDEQHASWSFCCFSPITPTFPARASECLGPPHHVRI